MPEIYTPIPDDSFLLGRTFYKPSEKGPVWAIAFRNEHGLVLTAAISVALAFIFARFWKIICFLALAFPGRRPTQRRYEVLVTLWNSNGPLYAFQELSASIVYYFGDWGNFVYGFIFCALAFIIYGGSISLSIVAPSQLQIGRVAPVRPSILYYPDPPDDKSSVEMLQWYSLVAGENLRALGSVVAAESEIRKRVDIILDKGADYYKTNGTLGLTYTYNITGVDLGLQYGSGLLLQVHGSCRTEYGWLANQTKGQDIYHLWNNEASVQRVPIDDLSILNTPSAIFIRHPDPQPTGPQDKGNTSFAIIITSAYRASITPGSDPWYKTEQLTDTIGTPYGVAFRVMRGRPALSCWQHDQWSYGTKNIAKVGNVSELGDIPGIKVKAALRHLLKTVFDVPVVVTLGIAAGDSSLEPGIKSLDGMADFIDAETARIEYDMERLLFASFIKSKNALIDTTMFESRGSLPNIMGHSRSEPLPGVGEFVIPSDNIQTFSMVGLIILLVVLLVLLVIELGIMLVLSLERSKAARGNTTPEDSKALLVSNDDSDAQPNKPGIFVLSKALLALQLFRYSQRPEKSRAYKECACGQRSSVSDDKLGLIVAGRETGYEKQS